MGKFCIIRFGLLFQLDENFLNPKFVTQYFFIDYHVADVSIKVISENVVQFRAEKTASKLSLLENFLWIYTISLYYFLALFGLFNKLKILLPIKKQPTVLSQGYHEIRGRAEITIFLVYKIPLISTLQLFRKRKMIRLV